MIKIQQARDGINIYGIPNIKTSYLDSVLSRESSIPLVDLFRHAQAPAKELTESYAAFSKLRRFLRPGSLVYHIGDGAHARTAALFAFLSKTHNVSIDPALNLEKVNRWITRWEVERLDLFKGKWGEFSDYEPGSIVTLVHAHVNTEEVLKALDPRVVYVCACCSPKMQLIADLESKEDWCIFSRERTYQVWKKDLSHPLKPS